MAERLFKLNGESRELEDLRDALHEGAAIVERVEEYYYLRLQMDSEQTDVDALAAARENLKEINALFLIRDSEFRRVTIAGVSKVDPETGKIITAIFFSGDCQMQSANRGSLLVGTSPRPRQRTFAEQAFQLSLTNKALRVALQTFEAVGDQWPGLYKVFETVKKANAGEIPSATNREIDAFRATANNYGDDPTSRHGYDAKKAIEPRMTIEQARALVQKILNTWIKNLVDSNDQSEAKLRN
jgi:hypothetical protein